MKMFFFLEHSNKQDSAYLNKRVRDDSVGLIDFCIQVLQHILSNAILFFLPLYILLTMSPVVTGLLLIFVVIYITLYLIFRKPLYKVNLELREELSNLFASFFEQIKYIKQIKLNSSQEQINERANKQFEITNIKAVRRQKINYLFSGLDGFVSTLAQIVLFVAGGLLVLSGDFTIGMFTIFSSYFNMIFSSGRYFFHYGAAYAETLTAYDRINAILSEPIEHNGEKELTGVNQIILDNVSFGVLDNVNLKFEKGKIYGITGANGTGKSTLVSLIIGLYINEYGGNIRYNNIDIKELDMIKVRENLLAFSEQEPILIKDSIAYNLNSTKPEEEFTKMLGMDNFLANKGLGFIIDDKNSNVSGGEKQKLSILKALIKDTDLMVFDEPTSALDTNTTRNFISHLDKIKKDKIIILITHDSFIKENVDLVISL